MFRFDILNLIISKYSYRSYLEIGVKNNKNFNKILIPNKVGVDPVGNCKYVMTSDLFFKSFVKDKIYDIIFIDGLHLRDQVLRDINNSLNHLSDNGTIVVHDCNPVKREHASPVHNKKAKIWNGTTWEAYAELRMKRNDLFMCVIDTDHGCGIIRNGKQELYPEKEIDYDLLETDRANLLNLVSVDKFMSEII